MTPLDGSTASSTGAISDPFEHLPPSITTGSRTPASAIALTIVRNNQGPLSKAFCLENGDLKKRAAAYLSDGVARRVDVDNIRQLAEVIENLIDCEAVTLGITSQEKVRIATQKAIAAGRAPSGAISRDSDHFKWSKGRGVMMLDIDRPKDGSEQMSINAFDAMMCAKFPWWSQAARLYRPSASAFIYDAAGNELSGAGSFRCYVIVDKAENIPFLGITIIDALWKAGKGRVEFSKSGHALLRTSVDAMVWQPERLDFAGPAVLGEGLRQAKRESTIYDGGDIDTEAAVSAGLRRKMDFGEWKNQSAEAQKALQAARPEEKRRKTVAIEERVQQEVAAGSDEQVARRKWQAVITQDKLPVNFELHFVDEDKPVTVAEVLKSPALFDKRRCADPSEPDYANDPRIAVFYANLDRGRPYIFSHAHGGITYALEAQQPTEPQPVALAESWSQPQDIIALPKPVEYPLESLPNGIRDAVKETTDFVQCPIPMAASSILVALSMAGQGLVNVAPADHLRSPVSLYFLDVAESGERKTTAGNRTRAPFHDYETEQRAAAKDKLDKYNAELAAWEAEYRGVKDKITQAKKNGRDTSAAKKELLALEEAKPVKPLLPSFIYEDTTKEALAHGLRYIWPSAGLISSEGGNIFGGHSMQSENMMGYVSALNSLWDGSPCPVTRRQSDSFTLENVRLTMGVAVQPITVAAFHNKAGGFDRQSGFYARFLISCPESTQGTRMYREPEAARASRAFNDRIKELLAKTEEPESQNRRTRSHHPSFLRRRKGGLD